jgi:hypothetical protein
LVGCTGSDDSREPHAYADLYTDGTKVEVVGCPASQIIGCSAAAPAATDRMRLFWDGRTVDVPVVAGGRPPGMDRVIAGPFHDGPFVLTLPAPADDRVLVQIDQIGSDIQLPPPPALVAPAHVSRAQGMLTLSHDMLPGQSEALFAISTTCADGGGGMDGDVEPALGTLTVDLTRHAAVTGTCTHEIHVDQIVEVAAAPELPTRAIAISKATITSEP